VYKDEDNAILNSIKPFVESNSLSDSSAEKVIALDCEMSYTLDGMSVTRVTVVNLDELVILDVLVVPDSPVLDVNTRWSGVTWSDLGLNDPTKEGSNTTGESNTSGGSTTSKLKRVNFEECRKLVLDIMSQDTILIGHGLENDLRSLRVCCFL